MLTENTITKLQQMRLALGSAILFASPGVISDSWMMHGIFKEAAALTTGTETKPPLENTMSGFNSFKILTA